MAPAPFRDVWITTADGLRLYGRDYDSERAGTPILCLPGLTRNARDFEPLAEQIGGARRLLVMDFRGRGRSAYAPDPASYRVDVEADDALCFLDHLGIARAALIGTSRGGLVAMMIAAKAPDRLAGAFLNDIGPVIEIPGLLRIRSYLGKAPQFTSWAEAIAALRRTHAGFDNLTEAEWLAYAHRVYRDDNSLPRIDYDQRLGETYPSADEIESGAPPDLWPLFEALKPFPCAVLRGENSDLLSEATVAEMVRRHPRLVARTVRQRGHVPFLDEAESLSAIREWLDLVELGLARLRTGSPLTALGF